MALGQAHGVSDPPWAAQRTAASQLFEKRAVLSNDGVISAATVKAISNEVYRDSLSLAERRARSDSRVPAGRPDGGERALLQKVAPDDGTAKVEVRD